MSILTTRREFLGKSLSSAGLTIALLMSPSGYKLIKSAEAKTNGSFNPNLWIRISRDNVVTVVINKSEMGQGVCTSLPMIVADELEADWKQIRFLESPTGEKYQDPEIGMQLTGGSTSVRHMYNPLRKAGAAAREMLVRAAAETWGVSVQECEAVQGSVKHSKSGKSMTYGELSEKASRLPIPKSVHLKEESQFRYIGHSMDRLDIPDKVKGSAIFGIDVVIPGMLYGAIARPPAYGAKVTDYDKGSAEKIPGVLKIISGEQRIIVVADNLMSAWKGRDALHIKWGEGTRPDLDNNKLEKEFIQHLDKAGVIALKRGDTKNALRRADKKIESRYQLPYLAHVTMEPMDCTAHIAGSQCDVWVATQNQSGVLETATKITGFKPEQIHVHTTYLGGGFGRRGDVGYAEEALTASKNVGKPVKIIWTREEDIQHDVYRPGYCCHIEGALDSGGKVVAWSHKVAVPSVFEHFAPQRIKNGVDPAAVEGIIDMDYEIPNLHVEYVKVENPIPVGFWRSVGNSHNGFTTESFMDELAHAARKDPIEFRINLLKDHLPAKRLLETVADKAGWAKSPKKGQALGVAYHMAYGSRVAEVAEVSVDEKSGKVTVHRVICAIDCGPLVVNPAIITAQVTSAVIMGLSAAMQEKVDFKNGGSTSANFYNYHELRMSDAPEVEVYILKNQETMGGIGEPGLPPIAPAMGNAIFAATGKRIRILPIAGQLKKT